jgi:hypothetical protein
MVRAFRRFLPLYAAWRSSKKTYNPAVDVYLRWFLKLNCDSSLHDMNEGAFIEPTRFYGWGLWPGGARQSIPHFLLGDATHQGALTNLQRVDTDGVPLWKDEAHSIPLLIPDAETERLLRSALGITDAQFVRRGYRATAMIAAESLDVVWKLLDAQPNPMPFGERLFTLAVDPARLSEDLRIELEPRRRARGIDEGFFDMRLDYFRQIEARLYDVFSHWPEFVERFHGIGASKRPLRLISA